MSGTARRSNASAVVRALRRMCPARLRRDGWRPLHLERNRKNGVQRAAARRPGRWIRGGVHADGAGVVSGALCCRARLRPPLARGFRDGADSTCALAGAATRGRDRADRPEQERRRGDAVPGHRGRARAHHHVGRSDVAPEGPSAAPPHVPRRRSGTRDRVDDVAESLERFGRDCRRPTRAPAASGRLAANVLVVAGLLFWLWLPVQIAVHVARRIRS